MTGVATACRNGTRADLLAGRLALAGATLGLLAGLVELTIGPSMRSWVGDKQDTIRLGLVTIVLSGVAMAAAVALSRRPSTVASTRRVAIALALVGPALICFTTVGRLWYLPAALLLPAGAIVLRDATRDDVAVAFDERHWRFGLLGLCGAYLIALGATALGLAGVVGVVGGLLIWAVAPVAARAPRAAYLVLVCGALPFAVVTWWSIVTPLIAAATILSGVSVIRSVAVGHRPLATAPLPGSRWEMPR